MADKMLLIVVIVGVVSAALILLSRFLLRLPAKPVREISLTPTDKPRWSDKKKIAELMDVFKRNGFDLAGRYKCEEIPGLMIAGFVKSAEQLAGVINDHPLAGIWEDICVKYDDGESLTVSNAPMGQEMDHMPQSTMIYLKGSSLDELLAKALAERRTAGRITIAKEDFSSIFEEAYRKEMKWRMERGGPTFVEVAQVAKEKGISLDSAKLQNKTRELQKIWMKEKDKPRKVRALKAELPGEFQRPEVFRQKMEQKSGPIPQMNVPVLPVYVVLVAAIISWSYYGYHYSEAHGPVSLAALVIFFSVFVVLFITLMGFGIRHNLIKMCPFLKRIADLRPGAFLFMAGTEPKLFYARKGWLGKVVLWEGSRSEEARTRLEAITEHTGGWVSINRKGFMNRIFGRSDKDDIPLPEGEFSQKFAMSGDDKAFAEKLLMANIVGAVMPLEVFKKPAIEIDGQSVTVEVRGHFYRRRKEAELGKFLELAENIVDLVARQG